MHAMNLTRPAVDGAAIDDLVERACDQACRSIAPAWPLERAIAVNPHWERIGMPLRRVAARMAVLGGIRVFPERASFRQAWQERRIARSDLEQAIAATPGAAGLTPERCLEALLEPGLPPQLPLLIDLLDDAPRRAERLSWRAAVSHQVGQACAAYFDVHQREWQGGRACGLYAFWRESVQNDHGIGILMGLPQLQRAFAVLPDSAQQAERWALSRLNLDPAAWADYLEAVLLTVNGWASHCAWLKWEARLRARQDHHLRELLALRLAWGAILLECRADAAGLHVADLPTAWGQAGERIAQAYDALLVDEVWQAALEAGYQRTLARQLALAPAAPDPAPQVQAAFCIDVRSERMRRAIEAVWPAVQTIGVAGFFGVALGYTPLAACAELALVPGLLAPQVRVADQVDGASGAHRRALAARRDRFAWSDQLDALTRWPGAAFASVEAAGVGYVARLWQAIRPSTAPRARAAGLPLRYRARCRPQVDGMTLEAKVALAAGVLRAMGLGAQFAPLILLVGHGSQSRNNAHAAALECGACGGHDGEVNVRTLAQLLNHGAVRAGLAQAGIAIPDTSWFVAALHNTATDEIEGFDLDLLPAPARPRWRQMEAVLAQAGDQVRRERAPALALDARATCQRLLADMRRRANDAAQTRPEWGLAGNAAFLIAPRARSSGAVLDGRCFLHDYDAARDADGSLLETIMTAPMVVAHWINWQYHASTADPARFGSGNKLLHNVVGGNIGVFEGNGGDLRIGLARQSLHDGTRWRHDPLRLTVVIDAPAAAIEAVLKRHQPVRDLVRNGWLHLWRFDGDRLQRLDGHGWQALAGNGDRWPDPGPAG